MSYRKINRPMTPEEREAANIVWVNFRGGGPGYNYIDTMYSWMSRHPRGKGFNMYQKADMKLYESCLVYARYLSRSPNYKRVDT